MQKIGGFYKIKGKGNMSLTVMLTVIMEILIVVLTITMEYHLSKSIKSIGRQKSKKKK